MISLYYYTNYQGHQTVTRNRVIRESTSLDDHARFGPGVYLTSLPPSVGKERIIRNFWGPGVIDNCVRSGRVDYCVRLTMAANRVKRATRKRDIHLHRGDLALDNYHWESHKVLDRVQRRVDDRLDVAPCTYYVPEPALHPTRPPNASSDRSNQLTKVVSVLMSGIASSRRCSWEIGHLASKQGASVKFKNKENPHITMVTSGLLVLLVPLNSRLQACEERSAWDYGGLSPETSLSMKTFTVALVSLVIPITHAVCMH
ncbi:hypothetical protein ACOMHN_000026 [Nucella lapillus]